MRITAERIGESVLVSVYDGHQAVKLMLPLHMATELGTILVAQACADSDGLDIPADLRPKSAGS